MAWVNYSGPLSDGPKEWSAGPHGPYYVIFRTHSDNIAKPHQAHQYYLVPDAATKQKLLDMLKAAQQDQLIPEEYFSEVSEKIKTYSEYLAILDNSFSEKC